MERIIFYISSTLPPAGAAWLGIAAVKMGLRRWGKRVKVPLGWIFLVLWGAVFAGGFVGGQRVFDPVLMVALGSWLPGSCFGWSPWLPGSWGEGKGYHKHPPEKSPPGANMKADLSPQTVDGTDFAGLWRVAPIKGIAGVNF